MDTQLIPDDCILAAMALFIAMHDSPSLQNAERLVIWLGENPGHVRALDIALTEWGLAIVDYQCGHDESATGSVLSGHQTREKNC